MSAPRVTRLPERIHLPTLIRVPLFWRLFAVNAMVLALATAALALSPVTVSSPVAVTEAIVRRLR